MLILAVLLLGSVLERDLEARIAREEGVTVSVAYHDLDRGETLELRAGVAMHAASTMKLPVMMEAWRRAAAGELDLDAPVPVENRFRSIVDGSEFSVDPADDEDRWTHEQIGKGVPFRKLIERMVVRSSNLATNIVIERLGAANVTSLCRALGAETIHVRRGVEDSKAFRAGLNNETTARDLARLLEAIGAKRARGADDMIDVLARQELDGGIAAGVPKGTRVAHKTGSITRIWHDAALVLPRDEGKKGYVLVVLTKGFDDTKRARRLVTDVSRRVYEHYAR